MEPTSFKIGNVEIGLKAPLFLIAGPCVIESRDLCLEIAESLARISLVTDVPVIFKASYDKANRTSVKSFRGPGMKKGLQILADVREKTGLPILTDVHDPAHARPVAEVVDCLQIPAFLCRQTDLICACAETGKPLNVKKGQFVSPWDMKNVVEKALECDNNRLMLTERGTFFGYNRLVNDMTAIADMKALKVPVVFDGTHSTQMPGGLGGSSGGRPEMAGILSKAAVAAGANGLFLEVHPEPKKAKSDAACMLDISSLEELLTACVAIFDIVRM